MNPPAAQVTALPSGATLKAATPLLLVFTVIRVVFPMVRVTGIPATGCPQKSVTVAVILLFTTATSTLVSTSPVRTSFSTGSVTVLSPAANT